MTVIEVLLIATVETQIPNVVFGVVAVGVQEGIKKPSW